MFNCSTNCLCPIRIATNGSTSLLNENFKSTTYTLVSGEYSLLNWKKITCTIHVVVRSLSAKYRPDRYRRDKSVKFGTELP